MATQTESDKGIGLSLAFGLIAALGAVGMLIGAPDIEAAYGFTAAIVFGSLAVVALHLQG